MSNNNTELKYFEKLNISVLSIDKCKTIIKNDILNTINAWNNGKDVLKQCFHIIGSAGIGKTQICYQIGKELSEKIGKPFEIIRVTAPVLSRDDFLIPFPVVTDAETSFKMLYSDFVPKDKDSFGLFVIDEFSRGDHTLQRCLWQVQNECAIHRHEFPKGWFVISVDNPDDSEYSMDTLQDAAGLRRQLHIYTEVNTPDFLNHGIKEGYHKYIIEFIQTHPDFLYDFEAQKVGSVYANPASYEKLSDHLWKFELNGGIKPHYDDIEIIASGLLNVSKARLFMEFLKEQKDINPKDVFYKYDLIKEDIDFLIEEENNTKLGELMVSFCTYLATSKPEYKEENLENVAKFLSSAPIDTAAMFMSQVDTFSSSSDEFKYLTILHAKLLRTSELYKKGFFERIANIQEKE